MAHARHFRYALGIVDDGAVGVIGHDDAGEGKHADRGDADPVDAGKAEGLGREIGGESGDDDADEGGGYGDEAVAEARDDREAGARGRDFGDVPHGPEFIVGEIVGGEADDHADDETGNRGDESAPIEDGFAGGKIDDGEERGREHTEYDTGEHRPEVERLTRLAVRPHLYELEADQRADDADDAEDEGKDDVLHADSRREGSA